jgi:hypothetical protein
MLASTAELQDATGYYVASKSFEGYAGTPGEFPM